MTIKPLLLAAVLAAVSLTGQAQSADKKALVAKTLKLQQPQIEQFGVMLVQSPVQQMLQQAGIALRSRVPEDKREEVSKAIDEETRKLLADITPVVRSAAIKSAPSTMGAALESKFSEAELKEINTILESAAFKRFLQVNGESQQALAAKVAADTRATVDPKLRAFDQKLVQLLGLQQPAAAAPAPKP